MRSNGITLTGADGVEFANLSGITLTGVDAFAPFRTNGITLTGADGITLTGADSITSRAADSSTYAGSNGITLTGADGITLTGADGITLTGADGITLTGADGTQYRADSIIMRRPNGITLTGADGITLTGADGITLTGADGARQTSPNVSSIATAAGITLTGADGITLTGVDGITLTGADSITGFGPSGVVFDNINPNGITLTGADGITLTGADGITLTGADGITLTGADGVTLTGADASNGLQSIEPELALRLSAMTDDSNVNAIIVYHNAVSESDLEQLRQIGIVGGTRMKVLPMVYVSATRSQLIAVSRLSTVRSIYGNRTLNLNADPYFNRTLVQKVGSDRDLTTRNSALAVSGRGVTVAVLDTGINAQHPDLAGKVVQNARLADAQSVPTGFSYPVAAENLPNTDLAGGHGTFVSGIVGGSGASSGGRLAGVAPGTRLLGLSAGDFNLIYVLSGFDYLLEKGAQYGVRVVNCSFSANTVFDINDPVNVATKMLTDRGVSVVFSAGNGGSRNGTLNPYAMAPWVVSVGSTDDTGRLAEFSSRGSFGDSLAHPTLTAPGVNIASLRSTVSQTGVSGMGGADASRLSVNEMPYYTTSSGTSFSAPQVSGAIALMLEVNPDLSPAEIKDILARSATPLPNYFYHEAGAGMLNTYAAVLEAAFPERRTGIFRAISSRNRTAFVTSTTGSSDQMLEPFATASNNVVIPADTVQAEIDIAWGLGPNDFGLKLFNANGSLAGESNYLNLPGITGRRESVVLRNPARQTMRAETAYTAGAGTSQTVNETVHITRAVYPELTDLSGLPVETQNEARSGMLKGAVVPQGRKYHPNCIVTRLDFAEALVRAGLVPQYVAGSPMFADVRDEYGRALIESVQTAPGGLFYDAAAGGRFNPTTATTKLVAAVAYVRAANLDAAAQSAAMAPSVADLQAIPIGLRGYVAVALQRGFMRLDGNFFNPDRAVTRIDLAYALNRIIVN